MIKNRSVLFLAGLISVFTSCKNDDIKLSLDEVVLNHKNSGSFSATITNSENTPYAGKEVQLFDDDELIDKVTTDDLGIADFSQVNEGNYTLKGDEYEEGGVTYSFSRTIQIVTGEEKNITIIPSAYSGKVTISVFEQHQTVF